MGLFDFMKVCLFSEINGVVTLDGKPVAGAEIVRTAIFKDKPRIDKAITDEAGKFHFDAMYGHSLGKLINMFEMVIPQTMTIHYHNHEFLGWRTSKRDYHENAELDSDRDITLSCDLSNEPSLKDQQYGRPVRGVCDIHE